ncbi:hypothetical protein KHS38_03320 [Mucilaginibacter sp. Bleaf8]|uniref:hypothetical protein n=1 Tax=Mucilaginibacter sp. Bleaf8 TaxID=2834430 RepID=UPI001BCF1F36|nr:hypothetical protein [Mucilaginibacter sp. Bleaf8]MBS7563424.1 hypothetical protein [Mucilaginibacter sp. Bleaf8]
MKNIVKIAIVAVAAISFASCDAKKSDSVSDSTAIASDSTTTLTSGDTTKNMDSMRADSNSMQADTSTSKPE